jgi:hypothetical protein
VIGMPGSHGGSTQTGISMGIGRRSALLAVAGVLVVSACSNHAGLTRHAPPSGFDASALPLPSGLAGASGSGKASGSPSGVRSSRSTAAGRPASAASATGPGAPGVAVHTSSRQPRTGGAPGSPGRSSPLPPRSTTPAPTGPQVGVSPGTGLHASQPVRVTATGFPPNTSVQIAECLGGSCRLVRVLGLIDGSGRLSRDYVVADRVDNHVCGSSCRISVSGSGAAADAGLSFG